MVVFILCSRVIMLVVVQPKSLPKLFFRSLVRGVFVLIDCAVSLLWYKGKCAILGIRFTESSLVKEN